jgi:cullin 2
MECEFWVSIKCMPFYESRLQQFFSLYSDVYAICVAFPDPLADRLYSETKNFLENYVKSQLDEFNCYMSEIRENEGANQLLYKYYSSWKNYSKGLQYLNCLYQ